LNSSERIALPDRILRGRNLPGALLVTGPGNAILARESTALAAALLCPGNDPDRRCDSCRRVAAGLHPDLLVIAPEGVQIRIDRIREAIAFAAGRPYESRRRVAIISRAEQIGAEAGNALLKTLEEPGSCFSWILTTTRPESLPTTIRSRCAVARIPPDPPAERLAAWRERGFSEEDVPDLALAEREGKDTSPEDLSQYRRAREIVLEALEAGLEGGRLPALLLLAETLARTDERGGLLAELLADAAASRIVSADLLRHRTVAGPLQRIAKTVPRSALERAALRAVDAPPDSRRGNRRLHYESLLLDLYLSRGPSGEAPVR